MRTIALFQNSPFALAFGLLDSRTTGKNEELTSRKVCSVCWVGPPFKKIPGHSTKTLWCPSGFPFSAPPNLRCSYQNPHTPIASGPGKRGSVLARSRSRSRWLGRVAEMAQDLHADAELPALSEVPPPQVLRHRGLRHLRGSRGASSEHWEFLGRVRFWVVSSAVVGPGGKLYLSYQMCEDGTLLDPGRPKSKLTGSNLLDKKLCSGLLFKPMLKVFVSG